MNQKKNKKIILILMIMAIIIILGLGIAYVYLATDLLKSNKQNFMRYTTQSINSKSGIIDKKLINYIGKKKTTPYKDEGKIEFNMTSKNNQEQLEGINNFNISFSGEVEKTASKAKQNITLNYSGNVNLPITYQQSGDIYGVQIKNIGVGDKFIALEGSKVSDIINEIDVNSIKESIDNITEENVTNILNNISTILKEQIDDSKFIKITNEDGLGYRLSLTQEEVKNLIENNQTESTEMISKMLESYEYENMQITVFGDSGKFTKLTISTENNDITLEKSFQGEQEQIKITATLDENNSEENVIIFTATYNGLSGLDTIKESYELEINANNNSFKYEISNAVNFTESVNIEELNDENSLVLTDPKYSSDRVRAFTEALTTRLEEVNADKMEKAGIEENKNPFMYIIPIQMLDMSITNDVMQDLEDSGTLEQAEISAFNVRFSKYESNKLAAQTVRGLMSVIENSNSQSDLKIEEINLNGEEYKVTENNIGEIKDKIETNKNYRVEFEMDPVTGAIYRAVINEVADNSTQP